MTVPITGVNAYTSAYQNPLGAIANSIETSKRQPGKPKPPANPKKDNQQQEKDPEYRSPVSAMLNQVHDLLGKMNKGLPGFDEAPETDGPGGPGGGQAPGGPGGAGGPALQRGGSLGQA